MLQTDFANDETFAARSGIQLCPVVGAKVWKRQ
jgi:hypothetical protein